MLTTIETCRQQDHNVFAFVTAAVAAHFARKPAPSAPQGVNGYAAGDIESWQRVLNA